MTTIEKLIMTPREMWLDGANGERMDRVVAAVLAAEKTILAAVKLSANGVEAAGGLVNVVEALLSEARTEIGNMKCAAHDAREAAERLATSHLKGRTSGPGAVTEIPISELRTMLGVDADAKHISVHSSGATWTVDKVGRLHPLAASAFDGTKVALHVGEDGFFKPGDPVVFVDVSKGTAYPLRVLSTAPGSATLINEHAENDLKDVTVTIYDYFTRLVG